MTKIEQIKPFAKTDRERLVLNLLSQGYTQTQVADKMGISRSTVQATVYALRDRAEVKGVGDEYVSGEADQSDTPFYVKGTSTLYDAAGNPKLQWVKTNIQADALDKIAREIVEALKEDIPKNNIHSRPVSTQNNSDLLNLHVVSDYHLGMFAWKEQNHDSDWSTSKAEKFLVEWFRKSIESSPFAGTGILLNLGDFLTSDSVAPITPSHGHLLDVDQPFQQVIRAAIRVYRQIVEMMKQKYEKVHIISVSGNHDLTSGMWFREFFAAFYENDPRVTVDDSPDSYHCYEHGDTSLFMHHGHRRKMGNVSDVFAAKFREVFGRTKHSYAHLGHRHSIDVKESNLMVVEQHRTLAPQDQYASGGGWLSGRSSYVITYHKEHGEVARVNVSAAMVDI